MVRADPSNVERQSKSRAPCHQTSSGGPDDTACRAVPRNIGGWTEEVWPWRSGIEGRGFHGWGLARLDLLARENEGSSLDDLLLAEHRAPRRHAFRGHARSDGRHDLHRFATVE